ncbi:MAG: pyridoxamine 5'-phosphate oxidase family protein [Alphaproteobacteria bacterium]
MTDFKPTPRTRIKRLNKRAHYDRETTYAVLDAGIVAHVGYVFDGHPYVTSTSYWREDDRLFWHGSSASRMLRTVRGGVPVCVNVSLLDGLVLARSGFHHSVNYRAVMVFGQAEAVTDADEKLKTLEAFTERLFPGRWAEIRPVTEQELKATMVLSMKIEEAATKIRTGHPVDDEPDYDLDVWAGVVPLKLVAGEAMADPRLKPGVHLPDYLRGYDLESYATRREAAE